MALLLTWDWFSPTVRGLMTGFIVSFQLLAMAAIISVQIAIIESDELKPIKDTDIGDANVDIFPQSVASELTQLFYVLIGF